jgi:hypothetical protein
MAPTLLPAVRGKSGSGACRRQRVGNSQLANGASRTSFALLATVAIATALAARATFERFDVC